MAKDFADSIRLRSLRSERSNVAVGKFIPLTTRDGIAVVETLVDDNKINVDAYWYKKGETIDKDST